MVHVYIPECLQSFFLEYHLDGLPYATVLGYHVTLYNYINYAIDS